ncbi:unnamed protein product [Schistosoma curassoni]|uniref:Endo/exonuclease/phosphatase domain-containing protein n=1 Tax=Schistosoma curassoni TaxID=6186 RepID=A0A183JFD2_9TREM|nr:unnamed protein product [Schistosoma curassoni]
MDLESSKHPLKQRTGGITMNVIQRYAPTNDSNDDDKDRFDKMLKSITAKWPGKHLGIVMGDLNAKNGENPTTTVEKALSEGNIKQLNDTTKELSGKCGKPERPVKNVEGNSITEIQEQRNSWVEHSEELLNRPAPLNPPNNEATPTEIPIDVPPPTVEKIRMALRQMENGRAA